MINLIEIEFEKVNRKYTNTIKRNRYEENFYERENTN